MKKLILLLFLTILTPLLAGPERHDHLGRYKKNNVKQIGPKQELVYKNGKLVASANYSYNNKNQLIKINYSRVNKSNGYTTLTYNHLGLIKENTYDNSGVINEEVVYKLNKKGFVIAYNVTDYQMNQNILWTFKYNNKMDRVISGKRLIEKKLSESFSIKNKGNGNFVRVLFNYKHERSGFIENIYYDQRLVKRIRFSNTGMREIHYIYSKFGKLTSMKFYLHEKDKKLLMKEHILKYTTATPLKG